MAQSTMCHCVGALLHIRCVTWVFRSWGDLGEKSLIVTEGVLQSRDGDGAPELMRQKIVVKHECYLFCGRVGVGVGDGQAKMSGDSMNECSSLPTPPPVSMARAMFLLSRRGGHWKGGPCFFLRRGGVH